MSLQHPSGGALYETRSDGAIASPVSRIALQLDLSAYDQGLDEINRLGTALRPLR